MNANTAKTIADLVNSKKINVVDIDEFSDLHDPKVINLIPTGSLFMCNREIFIFYQKKFHHIKFCGCDPDHYGCWLTSPMDIPKTPRNKSRSIV